MPRRTIDDSQATYIRLTWTQLREANREAAKHSERWRKLNDEIDNFLDRQGVTDVVRRTEDKAASIPLGSAMSAYTWWRDEANRLANAIMAEKAANDMINEWVSQK